MSARLIAVTRAGVREADIFRLWLDYYRPHVDGFHILIVRERDDDIAPLEELCRYAGAPWTVHECAHFESLPSLAALQAAVTAVPCDWVLHTDTDEFLRGMAGIRQTIARMEAVGADHLVAHMIDRLTPDGRLRGVEDLASFDDLAAAFPVEADITRKVAAGGSVKYCLARWPLVCMHHPAPSFTKLFPPRGALDHFKWRTGLRDRLTKRYIDFTLTRIPWADESARLMEELHTHGRFRVENWPSQR